MGDDGLGELLTPVLLIAAFLTRPLRLLAPPGAAPSSAAPRAGSASRRGRRAARCAGPAL